ncbi:MAG: hypothetical protein ACK4MV_12980 [Beijerinckiaceae bacterium]
MTFDTRSTERSIRREKPRPGTAQSLNSNIALREGIVMDGSTVRTAPCRDGARKGTAPPIMVFVHMRKEDPPIARLPAAFDRLFCLAANGRRSTGRGAAIQDANGLNRLRLTRKGGLLQRLSWPLSHLGTGRPQNAPAPPLLYREQKA